VILRHYNKARHYFYLAIMVCDLLGVKTLLRAFKDIHTAAKTGKLSLTLQGEQWHYYFLDGRFLFASGGPHRVRRWQRALTRHCPHWRIDIQGGIPKGLWEYQLLHRAVSSGSLEVSTGKAILAAIAAEVLFTSLRPTDITCQWTPSHHPPQHESRLALSPKEFRRLFDSVLGLWQQWQGLGLTYISPDHAALWTGKTGDSKHALTTRSARTFFNGQYTLWDIAQRQRRSLSDLTRTLHHFINQGTLQLRDIGDLPSPIEQMQMVAAAVAPPRRTIAYIDDSATAGAYLRQIIEPQGFELMFIQNPLQNLPLLLKQQPELIFLDLNMPLIHGCDFCSFLRKTSIFQATPIVILTNSDGTVDRLRANLSGASDFLAKPAQKQDILQVLDKYIQSMPLTSANGQLFNSHRSTLR
jgi:chemotaxis family two-component system response regulator PixG